MTSTTDPPLNPETISLIVAEYKALREEILKRIEIQHQLISLALAAPATFVGFGIAIKSATLILLYPILATCLSIAWSIHELALMRIWNYIQAQIEEKVGNQIHWEHYMYEEVHKHLLTKKL